VVGIFAFLDLNPVTLMILGVLAILLFGDRLPEVARSIGKSWMEFKKGLRGIQDELHSAIDDVSSSVSSSVSTPAITHESPYATEDREEATAPKFEPPPAETPAKPLDSEPKAQTAEGEPKPKSVESEPKVNPVESERKAETVAG